MYKFINRRTDEHTSNVIKYAIIIERNMSQR